MIYLFSPPRQIVCNEAAEFTSAIIQEILAMLNCRLKVISPYNHSSSKCERQIKTISEIIVKHLWDKGQMWSLFAMTAAYAMNTFASEALSGFSPFQLVFLRDPPDLTSFSFLKIDTVPVNYHEYYNLLLARAQMIGRLLLEWRTQQALEYEKKNRQNTNEEIFQDDQIVYLLAPHSSALQTDTTKFKQDFIGPLFIDTALDKTHYRLKDATGLLLDGTYHVNRIKKGSVHSLECKINITLPAHLPIKIVQDSRGPVTSSDNDGHEEQGSRNKRTIPLLVIAQGTAAIRGMLIKGINALVDAKSEFFQ